MAAGGNAVNRNCDVHVDVSKLVLNQSGVTNDEVYEFVVVPPFLYSTFKLIRC